jgi:hypothetical protein
MATEKQARQARDVHQERLLKRGAHAISVEPVGQGEGKDYAVVAWVKNPEKGQIPRSLSISDRGRKVQVPLVTRESKSFQLE